MKKKTNTYISKNKLTSRNRIYYTHDNGGCPFKVVANNKGIFIYKRGEEERYDELVYSVKKFLGYWRGYDSTRYKQHGNSILIQINKYEYVCVRQVIYKFKTNERILDYITPLGPSDVPYPIAYGENYIYFMLDFKMIHRDDLETPITIENAEKLYGEFYGYIGDKKGKHKKYNMKNVKILVGRQN